MDREELVTRVFQERRKTTFAYYEYLTKPREYIPGIKLHLRELDFLRIIQDGNGPTITEIAGRLAVTHGAASQTATRLTTKGLVVRRKNGRDLRSNIVLLTELGEKVVERDRRLAAQLKAKLDEMLVPFSEEAFLTIIKGDVVMVETLAIYDEITRRFMEVQCEAEKNK